LDRRISRHAKVRRWTKHTAEIVRRFFLGSFSGFALAYWLLSGTSASARPVIATSIPGVYATFLLFMAASYCFYVIAHRVFARAEKRIFRLRTIA
jgi:hypothetical protein